MKPRFDASIEQAEESRDKEPHDSFLSGLLGSRDASVATLISAHNSIGVPAPLIMLGTLEQKAELGSQLAAGDFSAFALTEDEAGCDLFRIRTYAVRIRDEKGAVTGYKL